MSATKGSTSAATKRASSKAKAAAASAAPAETPATSTVPVPVTMTATDVPATPELLLRVPEEPTVEAPAPAAAAASEEDTAASAKAGPDAKIRIPAAKLIKWAAVAREASAVASLPSALRKSLASIAAAMETQVANKTSGAAKAVNRPLSGYNVFVQEHIQTVAKENPGLSNKEIMTKIAEMWQQHKATAAAAAAK